ncbi:hypothetical protein PFISCL1PPCAC_15388, partial [Pristionchus fissidentatus]
AAELEELRQKSPLIHEMPYKLMRALCEILDSGDVWMEIAPMMPDIAPFDVEGCRKYGEQGSPSFFLLRTWASKGYCVVDLYNLFAMCRLVRCMQLMNSAVDSKFHFLEEYCTANTPGRADVHIRLQSSAAPTAGTSNVPTSARGHQSQPPTSRASTISSSTNPVSTAQSRVERDDASMFSGMKNTPSVTYAELMEATDQFDVNNVIGRGGYGVVYRGEWKQTQVAVKRLSASTKRASQDASNRDEAERLKQSLQELNTLAMFRHDNILPVYAYSLDGPDPCLVYQFMANGSLDDRLQCKKGTPPLTWEQKAVIAKGSAMALHFLHTISRLPLIHGDVKTANILLDRHMEPKLGDFGLSREGAVEMDVDDKAVLIASHIKGTLAYLPPEFISSKVLTTKLDVYAFGVVLLEIATGLRPYLDTRRPASLVDYALDIEAKSRTERGGGENEDEVKRNLWSSCKDRRTP